MSLLTIPVFQNTFKKTEEWLDEIMNLLDWADRKRAYKALREVLHTLRDLLTVQEATDLAAQLPMLLKGVYYDGWNPSHKPTRLHTADEFVAVINQHFPDPETSEYIDPEDITRAVLKVVANHVSAGEIKDIVASLPEKIRDLFD